MATRPVEAAIDNTSWFLNYAAEQVFGRWLGSFDLATRTKDPLVGTLAVASMIVSTKGGGQQALTPGLRITTHALKEAAKDGVTPSAIKKAIQIGEKFYDPKNNSIVSVIRGGMASGKNIAVAQDAITGAVKTVFTSRNSVTPSRFIPIR